MKEFTQIASPRTWFSLLCLILVLGSTANAKEQENNYVVELVEADPTSGFEYPYFLRTPLQATKLPIKHLVVETNNSGVSDSAEHHLARVRDAIVGQGPGPMVATDLTLPLLMPVFPRSEAESLIYTHALDRDTMLISEGKRRRLDLQLLKMVEDAQARLQSKNWKVEEKIVMVGFSASGTFANRFAFLHPNRLLVVASGAVNAIPMLPSSSVAETELDYPLGLNDFRKLQGSEFDLSSWTTLAQMIFMGALDDNDAVKFDDAFSNEERAKIYKTVGNDMTQRWLNSQAEYLKVQPNVTFITYGKVGHWTNGKIRRDMVGFVRSAIEGEHRDK